MTRHQKEDLANKYFNLYRRNYIRFSIITIISELLFGLVCIGLFIEFTGTSDRVCTLVILVLSLVYMLLTLITNYLCYSNVKDCINDGCFCFQYDDENKEYIHVFEKDITIADLYMEEN